MDGLKLINPKIPFSFAGEDFDIHKANLEKVILFQARLAELAAAKDPTFELKASAYALYLVLKDVKPEITEDWVLKNAPGDIDLYEIVGELGFMNRQKVVMMKSLIRGTRNAPEQTGESSLTS